MDLKVQGVWEKSEFVCLEVGISVREQIEEFWVNFFFLRG